MKRTLAPMLLLAALLSFGCTSKTPEAEAPKPEADSSTATAADAKSATAMDVPTAEDVAPDVHAALSLTSKSFPSDGEIPVQYTCEGEDLSPHLAWSNVPDGAKSLVLIVDDPDAPDPAEPKMTWVHWVLYDIPIDVTELPEGASKALPAGILEADNDWKRTGYGGPCPPIGRHHYFHKLYALDTALGVLAEADKAVVEAAMEGHVLAEVQVVGTYQKTVAAP